MVQFLLVLKNMQKPFEIVVLGTSSATPTRDRNPSGQYVRLDKHHFLFDCGEGTQNQLIRYNLKLQKIRYILITHLHGDHYFGLPGVITSMALFNRTEPLTVVGPVALKPILDQILEVGNSKLPFELTFIPSDESPEGLLIKHPDYEIHTVELQHRIPCRGYILKEKGPERRIDVDQCEERGVPIAFYDRLKFGEDYVSESGTIISNEDLTIPGFKNRSFAYISDTIYDERILPFIKNVDFLYHEATFLHDRLDRAQETFHSTAKQAGIIAKMADVHQLMVGHYSARYTDLTELHEEVKSEFENSHLAIEGNTYQITPKSESNYQVTSTNTSDMEVSA
jgi:ribonuclease Z